MTVNCTWAEWSQWTSCSTTCGSGQQTRNRDKATEADYGGIECTGEINETQACPNNPNCPSMLPLGY